MTASKLENAADVPRYLDRLKKVADLLQGWADQMEPPMRQVVMQRLVMLIQAATAADRTQL